MQAYIYCADIYCEDCGRAIKRAIQQEGNAPADPADEYSFNSDEYLKGPYPEGGGEADCPQHCGDGPDCENAIEFDDGTKIGAWLENALTAEGVTCVREAIAEDPDNEVCQLWAEWYSAELEWTPA